MTSELNVLVFSMFAHGIIKQINNLRVIPSHNSAWQGSQASLPLVGVIHLVCPHRFAELAHTVVMPLNVCPVNQQLKNNRE